MVSLSALLGIVFIGLWLYALIDSITTDRAAIRNLPKVVWIVLILLVFPFGAMGWFVWGRPARPGERATVVPRVSAPPPEIDDAEVLLHIAERDRLLAQWAEEARAAGDREAGAATAEPPSPPADQR